MKKDRMCLRQDESGHWYCIPVRLQDKFEKLLYGDETTQEFDDLFSEYQLTSHINCYSFSDFKRNK